MGKSINQVTKRIERVNKDLEAQYDRAFDRVHKVLMDLGFGANYAEIAAGDIADDVMNGLVEGTPPEIPIWHEPDFEPIDQEEEEEEDDEELEGEEENDEEEDPS